MGFAEDKVYNHILRNMAKFKNIHVASLVDSLGCLTEADRDELHTRQEMRGSNATAYKFYQRVKCCRGWVTDLINALHQNNAGHLAEELQQVYDLYRIPSPRASAPPAAPNPAAASFPPDARPAVSVSAQLPFLGPKPAADAPLADPPHCTSSTGGSAATSASPAASRDVPSTDLDARAPVQEKPLEKTSPQPPPPPLATTYSGASDGRSAAGPLSCPTEAEGVAAGPPGGLLLWAAPPEQGREWLSQRSPVCVADGCFGNSKHLHRAAPGSGLGTSVPLRDPLSARGAGQPRNEPQEDVYISAELSAELAEPPGSQGRQEKEAELGAEHGEAPSSLVDVRSPLLIQKQFDAEQKLAGMLREHEGGDTRVETTAPRDASPSRDISWKLPVPEQTLPAGKAASSTPPVPAEEKVLPASAAPLQGSAVGGSFVSPPGRTSCRGSSATSIWGSPNGPEEDVELSKPGVLLSLPGESPRVASEATDHLGLSSDPLLMSSDSSDPGETHEGSALGRCSPVPGREEAGETRSCSPLSWRTEEIRVEHSPSVLLKASNELQDGAGGVGSLPDSHSRGGRSVPSSGDSPGFSLPYLVPAVGIALISAVAFLVYARLQK
ncbi:mitochondrial antiviral-signaling protein [Aythya fuligula]|uniref:Mitochondrial antiviral-signaling protein n=1 Tax=Aythya fuligula TaxID=219594 RepID=A0A6J3CU70_AYTFU|nr:mitochondrial antiviral-signaling protein [Aythya fuligula]